MRILFLVQSELHVIQDGRRHRRTFQQTEQVEVEVVQTYASRTVVKYCDGQVELNDHIFAILQ